jgi:hypothetical protein
MPHPVQRFLFNEPLKDSKSLKIFKISLTFRFDKLGHLSKSVHRGENSQILTVSDKKSISLEDAPGFERGGQPNLHSKGNSLFDEFLCKLGFFGTSR